MLKKYGWPALIFILVITYIIISFSKPISSTQATLYNSQNYTHTDREKVSYIYVDIRGAVMHPGVYKMASDQRIFNVIERAGGFHPEAVHTSINRAGFLNDGMIIEIHFEGMDNLSSLQPSTQSQLISLNQASQSELETLTGIGPQTAKSIIAYREVTPFKTTEDLLNVSGIGEVTYQAIKDQIVP